MSNSNQARRAVNSQQTAAAQRLKDALQKQMLNRKMASVITEGIQPTENATGMNRTRNTDPYTWSCPLQTGFQKHQWTGAMLSRFLGTKYTGQLLYHSAGSGKTLLMCLTVLLWLRQWWPAPSRMPAGISPKPHLIIFISESPQVSALKKNFEGLFFKSMTALLPSPNNNNFKNTQIRSLWSEFTSKLPENKVMIQITENIKHTDITTQQPQDTYILSRAWLDGKTCVPCIGRQNRLIRHPTPTMDRMHRGQNFRIQTASTYEGNVRNFSSYLRGFDNQRSGYPMLNIYLQHLIYMRTVLGDRNFWPASELARGSYYLFVSQLISQQYIASQKGVDVGGAQGLTEATAVKVKQSRGVDARELCEGDFVRFACTSNPNANPNANRGPGEVQAALQGVTDLMGDGGNNFLLLWQRDHKVTNCVSPFFKVTKVTTERTGNSTFRFLHLQRMMMDDNLSPGKPGHPVNSDIDQVLREKQGARPTGNNVRGTQETRTLDGSNIRRGFQIVDIVRLSHEQLSTDTPESRFDMAHMRESQQTLPNFFFKRVLANSGAHLRNSSDSLLKTDLIKDRQGTFRNRGLAADELWWLPYGRHPRNHSDEATRLEMWKTSDSEQLSMPITVPFMPESLFIGMTSQMALHLFHRLPDDALFIVDEVQKYVGTQDLPSNANGPNSIKERKAIYCMLSEAAKAKPSRTAGTGANNSANVMNLSNNTTRTNTSNGTRGLATNGAIPAERNSPRNSSNNNPIRMNNSNNSSGSNNSNNSSGSNNFNNSRGGNNPNNARRGNNSSNNNSPNQQMNNQQINTQYLTMCRKAYKDMGLPTFRPSAGGGMMQVASATPTTIASGSKDHATSALTELRNLLVMLSSSRSVALSSVDSIPRELNRAKVMVSHISLEGDATKVPVETPLMESRKVVDGDFASSTAATIEQRIGTPPAAPANQSAQAGSNGQGGRGSRGQAGSGAQAGRGGRGGRGGRAGTAGRGGRTGTTGRGGTRAGARAGTRAATRAATTGGGTGTAGVAATTGAVARAPGPEPNVVLRELLGGRVR